MIDLEATIAAMEARGLGPAAIVLALRCVKVLEPVDAAAEKRRAADRERKRLRKSAEVGGILRNEPSPDKEIPHTPLENNPNQVTPIAPKGALSPKPRGSRIPSDFLPDLEWAVAAGLSLEQAKLQSAMFIDHWQASPGARGVKQDWPATWRNWVRKAIGDRQRPRAGPAPRVNGLSDAFGQFDERPPRYDDAIDITPAQGSVLHLPAPGRRFGGAA